MRLWSIHPEYLDAKGLVAVWREALLARKVLLGKTRGYKHHPQLDRFMAGDDPAGAINYYLRNIREEAEKRGYCFDARKLGRKEKCRKIRVTAGQIRYEFRHLKRKLSIRDKKRYCRINDTKSIKPHPLFRVVPGVIEPWEIT
jgi:hypothetical protein